MGIRIPNDPWRPLLAIAAFLVLVTLFTVELFVGKISATAYGTLLGEGFVFVIAVAELPRILEISFPGAKIKLQQTTAPASEAKEEDTVSSSSSFVATAPIRTTAAEKKILNTLFLHQVNESPEMKIVWYFGMSGSDDYLAAKQSLYSKGLIEESDTGMEGQPENKLIRLSKKGFLYCRDHYEEITAAGHYYENARINEQKLKDVLDRKIGPEDTSPQ